MMEKFLLLETLVKELDQAQQELLEFDKSIIDSGDANWIKDQEKYIKGLKERINELQEGFN